MDIHQKTPLIHSTPLSKHLNKNVFLKLEAMQPTGSFKDRGVGSLCKHLVEQGAKHLVTSSGGNAGLAAAYAGMRLGVRVTVAVPTGVKPMVQEKIRAYGAKVIVHGDNWNSTDPLARKLAEEEGSAYVAPFDDPIIWQGNSTLIDEVAEEAVCPDMVITSFGGGGLFCGIAEGMKRQGWNDVPLLAVETVGADCFSQSLNAGNIVVMDRVTSMATTLGATRPTQKALDWAQKRTVLSHVGEDRDAVDACLRFADDHRVLVEPACGISLSLIYQKAKVLDKYENILVVLCGGAGVNLSLLSEWKEKYLARAKSHEARSF